MSMGNPFLPREIIISKLYLVIYVTPIYTIVTLAVTFLYPRLLFYFVNEKLELYIGNLSFAPRFRLKNLAGRKYSNISQIRLQAKIFFQEIKYI